MGEKIVSIRDKTHRAQVAAGEPYATLKQKVLDYLSECDNPVPDAIYRRLLREQLRVLVGPAFERKVCDPLGDAVALAIDAFNEANPDLTVLEIVDTLRDMANHLERALADPEGARRRARPN
jgi:hypothetical protein